jgi:hypothetical protein
MKYILIVLVLNSCSSKPVEIDIELNPSKVKKNDPSLTAPKVRKIWIPEKIEGDKYIEGHYMWVLENTSVWSQ